MTGVKENAEIFYLEQFKPIAWTLKLLEQSTNLILIMTDMYIPF